MYPILGRFSGGFLFSYTAAYALGILAGLFLTSRLARNTTASNWLAAWLTIMIGALIGGRLGFVFWRWDYFQQRPHQAFELWRGGLSYWGALLGGLLALWLWTRWQKRPFLTYANLFTPAFVLIHAVGWLACYLEGCAYGRTTFIGFLAADLPDEFGIYAVRYQTQMIGFFLTLILFVFLLWLWLRGCNARLFWIALFFLGCIQLSTTFLRGDPFLQIETRRLDTIFSGVLILVSSLAMLRYKPSTQSV